MSRLYSRCTSNARAQVQHPTRCRHCRSWCARAVWQPRDQVGVISLRRQAKAERGPHGRMDASKRHSSHEPRQSSHFVALRHRRGPWRLMRFLLHAQPLGVSRTLRMLRARTKSPEKELERSRGKVRRVRHARTLSGSLARQCALASPKEVIAQSGQRSTGQCRTPWLGYTGYLMPNDVHAACAQERVTTDMLLRFFTHIDSTFKGTIKIIYSYRAWYWYVVAGSSSWYCRVPERDTERRMCAFPSPSGQRHRQRMSQRSDTAKG